MVITADNMQAYPRAAKSATVLVIVKPLIAAWLWIGGIIILLGAITALLARARRSAFTRFSSLAGGARGQKAGHRKPRC